MTKSALEIPAPYDQAYDDVRYHAAGAEAEVYTAVYVATGQRVALKVLIPRPGAAASRERREKRFLQEASLLREAGGAHVARVYEVLDVRLRGELTKAFSMEWLPETFRDLVGRHADGLPLDDLDRYLREAIEGLQALHGSGVAVRDVRPENLLLSARGALKIADLGMARTDDSAASLVESSRYMAPEVLDGTIRAEHTNEDPPASAYFPSDVYGLGVIFYEAAAGVEKWEGLPVLGSVFRTEGPGSNLPKNKLWEEWHIDRQKRLPGISELRNELGASVVAAIDGMILKDRSERFDLTRVRTVLGGQPMPSPPLNPPPPVRRIPSWAYATAGLVLVGALGMGVVLTRQRVVPSGEVVDRKTEAPVPNDKPLPAPSLATKAAVSLRVETEPSGVEVSIDGVLRGLSPTDVIGLEGGKGYDVSLQKAGYKEWRRRIEAGVAFPMLRIEMDRIHELSTPESSHAQSVGKRDPKPEAQSTSGVRRAESPDRTTLQAAIGYYSGTAGIIDESRARDLFLKAADKGDPLARLWLARLMFNGRCGFQQDHERASARAKEVLGQVRGLAEQGDADAAFLVAAASHEGVGAERDYVEAVRWYRLAAEKGNAAAMCNLGLMYSLGEGVAHDSAEAVKWFLRSEERGNVFALTALGGMYWNGEGVAKDSAEAEKRFRRGAERGESWAMYYLGVMYANGEGVANDLVAAAMWYRRGAEKGNAEAMNNLGVMYQNGNGVENDATQAARWYRNGAERGNVLAMSNLGNLYDDGRGVSQDHAQAIEWWRKAARGGYAVAQQKLKSLGESW